MGFKYKIQLFLLAISGFFTSANAQITEGSQIFGGGDLGGLIVGGLDAITLAEIGTTAQAGIFIAVIAVFYFAEKNILEQVFIRLEDIIIDSMGGSSISGRGRDEYPTGAKGMAFAIAFLSANGVTGFIGLGVATLLGTLAIGTILIITLRILNSGAGNPAGRTASATGNAVSEHGGRAWNWGRDKVGSLLSEAGDEAQDAGNTGNEKEGEHAEQEIQEALEILNEAEGNLGERFEAERQELEQAIKEFNDVYKWKKEEDEELHSDQVQGAMDQARANLEQFIEALKGGNVRNAKSSLDEAVEDFQFLVKLFTNLDHDLEKEVPEDKDALNRVIDAADKAVKSHKEVMELKRALKRAEKEDEYLEKLAQSRGFKEMYRKAEKEEEEERQLEKKLEKLEMEDGKLLKELEKADNILQDQIKMDEDIFKTLDREVNSFMAIGEDNLVNTVNNAMNYIKENKKDTEFWEEVEAELNKCYNGLEALKNHAEHIEKIKKNEDRKERQVADNLEQHIKAMTG